MVSQDKEMLNRSQGLMGQFTVGFAKKWFGNDHGVSLMFVGKFPQEEGVAWIYVGCPQCKGSENYYRLYTLPYLLRLLLSRPLYR